jgi:hypothetical protein
MGTRQWRSGAKLQSSDVIFLESFLSIFSRHNGVGCRLMYQLEPRVRRMSTLTVPRGERRDWLALDMASQDTSRLRLKC